MKPYVLSLLLFISFSGNAQQTLNNYKYVLVPEKFSFLKEDNQYNLNALTKSLLEEKGFSVYFDNSGLPKDIAGNKCSALTVELVQKKSMFVTNLTLLLKDCQGNILFKSKEGKSREKEFHVSYNLALRDAFTSLDEVQYAYNGTANVANQQAVPAVGTVSINQASAQVAPVEKEGAAGTLYAQPTANGYQLIDTAPKIILTLFKTSVQDYFIAENGTANGMVLKKNGDWFFEYYRNGQLVSEKLSIKF